MDEIKSVSPVLEIRGLTKYLGNRKILDDISLNVNPGEFSDFSVRTAQVKPLP